MLNIFTETLRKYPPISFLDRKCNADYKIPDVDLVIKKGTIVYMSLLGIQNDANNFPNPGKYDPLRFSRDPNARKLILAFGLGPRNCIGKW